MNITTPTLPANLLRFQLDPHVIKTVVESQNTFARLIEAARPAMSIYLEQQQTLERTMREINFGAAERLALIDFSRTLATTITSNADQFARIQRSLEPFGGLSTMYAQMSESMRALTASASTWRLNALIEASSVSFHIHNYAHIATNIQAAALQIREAFHPTINAFLAVREAAARQSELAASFQIATREHFLTADLLRSMNRVSRQRFEFEDERDDAIKETDEHILLTLPEALSSLDPKLCQLWQGAWESLVSRNPDRIRHTLVSARELVTHVLHALSPDDHVKAWSRAKEHFHNGRPTRKARLLFIYSSVNNAIFEDYLRKDIEACLQLCDMLQTGTHSVAIEFTDAQLQVILRRVHSTVCALVEVKRAAV